MATKTVNVGTHFYFGGSPYQARMCFPKVSGATSTVDRVTYRNVFLEQVNNQQYYRIFIRPRCIMTGEISNCGLPVDDSRTHHHRHKLTVNHNLTNWQQRQLQLHTFGNTISTLGKPSPFLSSKQHINRAASSLSSQSPDYWTNDGIIEGVWIFSRHGDRTPSRPLTPAHRRQEEAAYWMTKLPIPDSMAVFESYSKYFPVVIQQPQENPEMINPAGPMDNVNTNQHVFIDVARNPFGFLTSKGLQQLADKGQRFFNRYNAHAHHLPQCQRWVTPQDFLMIWNVQVYSTNYLRTIMSIQSFLDGLFHTRCYYHPSEYNPPDRMYDRNIVKEERIPSLSNYIRNENDNDIREPLVTINVRDLRHDPLNAFDRNPALIAELVSEVMNTQDFLLRDGKATSLAARLANILPGLVRKNTYHQSIKKSNDFSRNAPSRINWVEAADHFICRAAHNVSLTKFSDYETRQEYEQTLHAMSYPTLAHLSWRFRKWYQHERLLAVIAAPPLREITDQIIQTPYLAVNERRPFVLYSCHDITILGLLYAIGADFLAIDGNNSDTIHHTSGDDIGRYVMS
jgi:Histidine phosphatase superfamily (branch 2)